MYFQSRANVKLELSYFEKNFFLKILKNIFSSLKFSVGPSYQKLFKF